MTTEMSNLWNPKRYPPKGMSCHLYSQISAQEDLGFLIACIQEYWIWGKANQVLYDIYWHSDNTELHLRME